MYKNVIGDRSHQWQKFKYVWWVTQYVGNWSDSTMFIQTKLSKWCLPPSKKGWGDQKNIRLHYKSNLVLQVKIHTSELCPSNLLRFFPDIQFVRFTTAECNKFLQHHPANIFCVLSKQIHNKSTTLTHNWFKNQIYLFHCSIFLSLSSQTFAIPGTGAKQ